VSVRPQRSSKRYQSAWLIRTPDPNLGKGRRLSQTSVLGTCAAIERLPLLRALVATISVVNASVKLTPFVRQPERRLKISADPHQFVAGSVPDTQMQLVCHAA
jgi:hypothetical protein